MAGREIRVGVEGKLSTLLFTQQEGLTVSRPGKKPLTVPLRQVLWAELDNENILHVSILAQRTKKVARVAEALMDLAYEGVKRRKNLRVLLNPHGGKGKAVPIYTKRVAPVFAAAHCTVDITHTSHSKHALDLCASLPLDTFDCLVTVSGDGLLHECLNGLAKHTTSPRQALKTPLAPIPTGSGNGMSINLLGIEQGLDVCAAALNAIKGQPMPLDVFSITQGGARTLSFMTQCVGLMAEVDLGTEQWRWMGDTRFVVGFLRGVAQLRACPVTLSMRVVEQDKERMAAAMHAGGAHGVEEEWDGADALPPLKYIGEAAAADTEGWTTFDKPLLYMYAGQAPYVGRDLMQFPVAQPNDGLIDIVAQELTSRGDMIRAMDGAEKGQAYWMPSAHYFKARAYRVTPAPGSKGSLSVDGEAFEWKEFEVEVHPGLARLVGAGGFKVQFDEKKREKGRVKGGK